MALPAGYEGRYGREAVCVKNGVSLLNTGTIDAVTGEIKVLMINFGQEPFVVRRGDQLPNWS